MKNRKDTPGETFKIPSDMLIDVLALIVKESLEHEIVQVYEHGREALVWTGLDGNSSWHRKIAQNIQDMLSDYNDYRYSENERNKWWE